METKRLSGSSQTTLEKRRSVDPVETPENRGRIKQPALVGAVERRVFLSGTKIHGKRVLRARSVNHRLRRQDVDFLLEVIREVGRLLADYLDPKRFVWVFFADAFMWPFDNQHERSRNPDEEVYIPLQDKMLRRWMQQEGVSKLPASFSDYLTFVTRTLEENQKRGAIAEKFEIAYFRSAKFSDPSREEAETIYKKYAAGGVPAEPEYRIFQDYIFRYLVREGGRLHLPVHIHSAVGIGDYFNLSEGNVFNLENILRDPRYASTVFVMIHGGYPYEREAIWLAAAKNVYLDSSLMEIVMYPSELRSSLKVWLETFPDKITFGTDSFPYNEVLGAEESYWLGVQSARTALAAALAEMVSMGEVSEAQALQLARGYLHDNAVGIYQGKAH